MSQNRQPANTVGLKPTQKGGTFTAIGRSESGVDLSAGARDPHLSANGWLNPIRQATPAERSGSLSGSNQRVYATDSGRKILIGFDEDESPAAVIKGETPAQDISHSGPETSAAENIRNVLRDTIIRDAFTPSIGWQSAMNWASVRFPQGDPDPLIEMQFTTDRRTYLLEHQPSFASNTIREVVDHNPNTGAFRLEEPLAGFELGQVMQRLSGIRVDDGEEALSAFTHKVHQKILEDPDMYGSLRSALHRGANS